MIDEILIYQFNKINETDDFPLNPDNGIFINLIFKFSAIFFSQSDQDALEVLLDKLNKLEEEISNLSNKIDQNNYDLQRIEESNQLRYVDLDKRIHQLETLILLAEEELEEEFNDPEENPLSGLTSSNESEEEFSLWSNSLKLIENSRYSEAAENLRLLILSYPCLLYTSPSPRDS